MMVLVHRARILLVRLSKTVPFLLCALVCICYMESFYALIANRYCCIDNDLILYKPISWFIGNIFVYEWQIIILMTIMSFAMETCVYNKLCIVYLCVNIFERDFLFVHDLYIETIYFIILSNILVCGFFIIKGIKLSKNR